MAPDPLFYQLLLVALVFICLILHIGWPDPRRPAKTGLDQGIGHFMLFEVDSEVQAPAPPMSKSPRTLSAASDQKSAPLPSSHQAG
jgi:hypothetical protein